MVRAAGLRLAILTGTTLCVAPVVAHAQESPSAVVVTAARRDTVALDSTSAVTIVFRLHNESADTVVATPALALGRGWEPLMRTAPIRVAPGATELWLAGVHAPSSAAAGTYSVRGSVTVNGAVSSDSTFVRVAERRAIEIVPLDAPGWIISGGNYNARFLVRNRGNVSASLALSATSNRGTRASVSVPVVQLAPGGTSTIEVKSLSTTIGSRAQDEVLELTAEDQHDAHVRVVASSRTTLVPTNGSLGDDIARIPTLVTLRAVQGGIGVSPATISGKGTIPDTKTSIEFSAYAPTSGQSLFGEREELRLGVHSSAFNARAGDGVYGFSTLTSNGALGFGAEYDRQAGLFGGGAYVQHSRWMPDSPTEIGAFFGTPRENAAHADFVAVGRNTAGNTAGVLSFDGSMPLSRQSVLAIETAVSDSNGMPSAAERGHLSGAVGHLSYDLSHEWAGLAFAGSQRGVTSNDLSLSLAAWKQLSAHAYTGLHSNGPSNPTSTSLLDQYGTGTVGATLGSWGSLDYVWTSRRDRGDTVTFDGVQRGIRATTFVPLGPVSLSFNATRGSVLETTNSVARSFLDVGGSFNVQLPKNGMASLFVQQSDGNALGGDGRASMTAGAIATVQVGSSVRLGFSSSASEMQQGFGVTSGIWYGQMDGRVEYRLPSSTTIGVHGHVWVNPSVQGAHGNNAVYLEVKMPVGLPVGRQRKLGRVEGRVADANGRPVSGVLVHVGDQVGVTNAKGQVSLSGLASGIHPISVDANGAIGQSMLVGDATVSVDGSSTRPSQFSVGLTRGAVLRGQVRVLDFATTVASAGDSLVEVGTLQNVTVALLGVRDTLYQTSDDRGRLNFGAVPPGQWTLAVLPGAELPDHHAFQAERISVTLTAGDHRDVDLQIVPRKRTVTFMGSGETLKVRQEPKPEER